MTEANVTLTPAAQAQARELQRQVPTFSEALLSIRWLLAQDPLRGEEFDQQGHRILRQGRAPGRPGIRVTYRYRPGEVVIVEVELMP